MHVTEMKFSIVNKFFRWKLKMRMVLFYGLHLLISCATLINEFLCRKHFGGHSLLGAPREAQEYTTYVHISVSASCSLSKYIYIYARFGPLKVSSTNLMFNAPKCLMLWPWSSRSHREMWRGSLHKSKAVTCSGGTVVFKHIYHWKVNAFSSSCPRKHLPAGFVERKYVCLAVQPE